MKNTVKRAKIPFTLWGSLALIMMLFDYPHAPIPKEWWVYWVFGVMVTWYTREDKPILESKLWRWG